MKILITGGLGFMGSNMVRYLLTTHNDVQIVNLDKQTYAGNPANLIDIQDNPNYSFVKGDIACKEDVEKAVSGVDCIINYAAETHVDRSILDPDAFIKTDVYGTYNLLEAVKNNKIKLMIQVSTDEVYGEVLEGEADENYPIKTSSPYSATKAAGDLLIQAYCRTYQTPVILTRSCNCYGPYQYPEKLIPLFITNLIECKKVPMYGDGSQIREWIYVLDHCKAIDFIRLKGQIGETYNIGTRTRLTNKEVTLKLLSALNKSADMIEPVKDRAGHDKRYSVNPDKLLDLGWKPELNFDEGLTKTVNWYKDNLDWWQPIKSGEYLKYYAKQYEER